jgi:hypothetical protein
MWIRCRRAWVGADPAALSQAFVVAQNQAAALAIPAFMCVVGKSSG